MLQNPNILMPATIYTEGLTSVQVAVIVAIRIGCVAAFVCTGLIALVGLFRWAVHLPAPPRPAWLRW